MTSNENQNQGDFFSDHSEHFLEMAFSSRQIENLEQCDGYGKASRECGDTVEFFLHIQDDIVKKISFYLHGCIFTNACANTVAHLMENKDIKSAFVLKASDIVEYLETLPKKEYHCATLVVEAFRAALSNYLSIRKNPWKKNYAKK